MVHLPNGEGIKRFRAVSARGHDGGDHGRAHAIWGTSALGGTANFTLNGRGTASVALRLLNGSPTYYKLQFPNGRRSLTRVLPRSIWGLHKVNGVEKAVWAY